MKYVTLALSLALSAGIASPQTQSSSQGPHRMEIILEQRVGHTWRAVDPGHVFSQNDLVRFHFRANFDGYLYVMNHSTSGKYEQLFPREETGRNNKIVAGKDYLVPATQTAFKITGPPGHEVIYWMVTPVEIDSGSQPHYVPLPPPPPREKRLPQNLLPRCDDALMQARGDCIDSSAGPRELTQQDPLPSNLAGVGKLAPRDLFFLRKKNTAVISSPAPLNGPVIYEFLLAHR